ncbi:MAG: hypothetical protein ACOCVM_07600 [Desulfovibrionaceae bacterium]
MTKGAETKSPARHGYLKDIAAVCLALRQRADYFLHNEPENLSVEDFDNIAIEMEELARTIDNFVDYFGQESKE